MESAALFIVSAVRRTRAGCIVQVFANQTRRAMGLEDPMSLDTAASVRVGVLAMRKLIQRDKTSN
jgi:uridine phosphorylase